MGKDITRSQISPPPHHPEELQNHREDDDQDFTCEICFQPTSLANKKFRNSDKCAHPFCTDCVSKYIRAKLEDEHGGDIKCPAPYCGHTLDPVACAPLVGRSLFLRWCDVLCEATVMCWETCYCPRRDCNVLILNECGGDLTRSTCPKCKGLFCFRCKTAWHGWFITCQENTNDGELKRLAALKGWKRCPSCRIFVERVGGCSIVTCRCGTSFCYNREDEVLLCLGLLVLCLLVVLAGYVVYRHIVDHS